MPTTCATRAPASWRGSVRSSATSSAGSSGAPAEASGAPPASRAATGAKMSRPWKVAETGSSRHGEAEISTASATPPNCSAAGAEQAVVRPDQQAALLGGPQRQRPPLGADVGVDDGQVHSGGHVRQRPREHRGAGAHVLARDAVREVDDAGVRADAGDHAVHDADELVGQPVVRQEGDRARHRAASASSASTRPSGVWGSASRSGSAPRARSSALVAGPIETSRGPSSVPAAAWKKRTEEADVKSR